MGANFIRSIPKIELHAHLNGSLRTNSVLELGEAIYGKNDKYFKDLFQEFIEFDGSNLDDCFKKFKFMHELTSSEKGLLKATQLVIRDFALDNVIYLELRTTPKTNEVMDKRNYLMTVIKAIETSPEVISNKIIVKILPSIDRSKPLKEAEGILDTVLELRKEYPQLIVGIDLSGNPKIGNFEDFKPILSKARENNLKLALHCAEVESPLEIQDMLNFGMDRCGHGTFLNGEQIAFLVKRGIAIECCLTSNVKCATVPNYNDHHFKRIFDHDDYDEESHSLVLCTDDCGVFNCTLSQELEIAANTFQIDREGIKRLQSNAIRHAFAHDLEKKVLREKVADFSTAFEEFN